MKHFSKLVAAFLTVLFVITAFSTVAFADGKVTYAGSADKFIFEPGSDRSPTDLFDGFKDVMPGDKLTQTVTINNKASKEVKVKIYMRATGAEEGSEEFLSKLNLTVDQVGNSNLFKASADQTDGLTDWVCLGTVFSGGKIDLALTLEVPADLGNEFQNVAGLLDWQFKIEEHPIEKDDPEPVTGDNSNMTLWYVLIAIAGAGILACSILLIAKKRKSNEE